MIYKAFISYSHSTDGKLAPALQSSLQQFAKPWNQLRAMRVFVDKASLSANPSLWPTIEAALNESEYFVLLATPTSAQSPWVLKEVECWTRLGRSRQLLIVLSDGEIAWSLEDRALDRIRTTALPAVLHDTIREEPLYTDLRWVRTEGQLSLQDPRFTDAVASLAATMRGMSKDDLYGEHVRQHRKLVRLRRMAVAGLAILTVAAVVAAFVAIGQRNEARRQAQIAFGRQLAAEAESARTQRAELLPYSLILGIESMRAFPSIEADQAIQRALALLPVEVQVMQHAQGVHAVAIQPGEGRIATATSDGVVGIWDREGQRQQRLADTHTSSAPVVFSPDGKLLATIDGGKALRVWDAATGTEKFAPLKVFGHAVGIAFSTDSRMIATSNVAGHKSSVVVWDVATGELVKELQLDNATEFSQGLAFSSDGRLAVVAYSRIRLWDTAEWRELPMPDMPLASVGDLRFSPEGRWLVAGGPGGKLWVWKSGESQPTVTLNGPALREIAFSADGKLLAAGGKGREARVWETEKWTEIALVRHEGEITSLAFSPSGSLLATGSTDRTAVVWAIPGSVKLTSMDHGDAVLDVEFSLDGQRLVTASADGSVRMWETRAASEVAVLPGGAEPASMTFRSRSEAFVKLAGDSLSIWRMGQTGTAAIPLPDARRSAALSSNGDWAAAATAGDIVEIWDVGAQRKAATLVHPGEIDWEEFERRVRQRGLSYRDPAATATQKRLAETSGTVDVLGFSANGQYLLTTRHDFLARVWDVPSQRIVASEPYQSKVTASAWSPDGRFVAFVKDGTELAVLTLPDGRKTLSVLSEGRFDSIALSMAGNVLAALEERPSGDVKARVKLWQSSDWARSITLDVDSNTPAVVLSPNGEWAALDQGSSAVRLLRTTSGSDVARFDNVSTQLVFSPDSRFAAFGSAGQTVHIWSLQRNAEHLRLIHTEEITAISFSQDARYIASGGLTYTRIFSILSGQEQARLLHDGAVERIQFSPDGRYVATTGTDSTRVWLWKHDDVVQEGCRRLQRRIQTKQWPPVTGEPFESRIARACQSQLR